MPLNFDALATAPRLLLEAHLKPLQGTRFQPTGFPNLGPATYDGPNGERMLLVESAQSMANRLETVCWDKVADDWVAPLKGLPLVKVATMRDDKLHPLTNSVLEAHRLNSEYIARAEGFDEIAKMIGYKPDQSFDVIKQLVPALLRYDINSLIHGTFLEEIAGVIRLPRLLSSFIEAKDVKSAQSAGVKVNMLNPGLKDGEGNVIFSREEFVSSEIVAFFNLDLGQLRAFGFEPKVNDLLIGLSLFKVQAFLESGLRLRTACDLELSERHVNVRRPTDYVLPSFRDLTDGLPGLIDDAAAAAGWPSDPGKRAHIIVAGASPQKSKRQKKAAGTVDDAV